MTELKPCPICGAKATFKYGGEISNGLRLVKVACVIGCVEQTLYHMTEKQASMMWNNRSEQASQEQWMPVGERLPEEYVPVLCFRKGIRLGYYHNGAWFDYQGYEWAHPRTHWMPLPSAPLPHKEVE